MRLPCTTHFLPLLLFLAELKAVFALFDKDGDGFVTVSEVTDVLLSMRISPSPDLIREIFQQVDLDGEDQSREWVDGSWVMGQMGHENRTGHTGHGSLGVDP